MNSKRSFCCYFSSFVEKQHELWLWKWLKLLHYSPPLNKAWRFLPVLLSCNEVKYIFKYFAESEYGIWLSPTAQDCLHCQACTRWLKKLYSRARRFATARALDIYLENFMYQQLGPAGCRKSLLCPKQTGTEEVWKEVSSVQLARTESHGHKNLFKGDATQKTRAPPSSGDLHSILPAHITSLPCHHSVSRWDTSLELLLSCKGMNNQT